MRDTLTSQIRFSIIITSYNQRAFIKDAVDSAIGQQNPAAEVIVVDDASTDGSQEILRQYGDAIRLVCLETNQGAGTARNVGADLARGEYLVFLDGDDVLLPWALEVFERIVQAKQPKLILSDVERFEERLPSPQPEDFPHEMKILEYPDYLRKDRLFTKIFFKVVDREAFKNAKGWPTDYEVCQDMDFILRLSTCGRTVLILEPPTMFYRVHAQNVLKRKHVELYILALGKMMDNERSGKYPGGKRRRYKRQAFIGALVLFWALETAKAGRYGKALKFLARGWPMVGAAAIRWLGYALKTGQPDETIKL